MAEPVVISGASDGTTINLRDIADIDPLESKGNEPKISILPPLSRVGYNLSIFILCIISVFILFLIVFLIFSKIDASDKIEVPKQVNIPDSTFNKKLELIKIIQEEKKSYRDFIVQISQMILLNLLLPTLTAILGYIFGSRSEGKG